MRPSLRSPRLALPGTQRRPPLRGGLCHALTEGNDEKAHVAQPVGGLVRQLVHEEPQHGAEVVLRARHRDLHGRRRLRIAVAAAGRGQSFRRAALPAPRPLRERPLPHPETAETPTPGTHYL